MRQRKIACVWLLLVAPAAALACRDRSAPTPAPHADAMPREASADVGTYVIPRDVKVPLHATPPKLDIACRGAPNADAARALLEGADRALAEAERKLAEGAAEPRDTSWIRSALSSAADRIRIGEVIPRSVKKTEEWSQREERLKAIVRRSIEREHEAYEKLAPVAVGTWARIGPSLSAKIGEWVCPAVPKQADPGSLNDEQREGCGLVLELRSAAKLQFAPNPWVRRMRAG